MYAGKQDKINSPRWQIGNPSPWQRFHPRTDVVSRSAVERIDKMAARTSTIAIARTFANFTRNNALLRRKYDRPGRKFCSKSGQDPSKVAAAPIETEERPIPTALLHKYKVFKDQDAEYILDIHEEQMLAAQGLQIDGEKQSWKTAAKLEKLEKIDMKRGEYGVFDVEQLVALVRGENAQEVCCIQVPKELRYADHLVIATVSSSRHLKALAEFVNKVYKMKSSPGDKFCRIEGLDQGCKDWLAMDLGNVVLHLFLAATRELYDLESLWTVGSEYDDSTRRPARDHVADALKDNTFYLDDISVADEKPAR